MTTTAVASEQRAEKFPGGRVVAGCFIVLAVSSGLGFYGLAVYLNAFSNERGWPVASISLATTLYFIVGGVTGLNAALAMVRHRLRDLVDRVGPEIRDNAVERRQRLLRRRLCAGFRDIAAGRDLAHHRARGRVVDHAFAVRTHRLAVERRVDIAPGADQRI